jgi:cyanophycin synthetase
MTPGRVNLLRVGNARVLVDYAHNAAAVEGLVELSLALPARRRIGVVAAPGDRRDEDILALGRLLVPFEHIIVREDVDRRGREPGETAALIERGLREAGMPPNRIEIVLDENEAVECALAWLEDGDLAVILADRVSTVLSRVPHQ